MVAHKNNKSDTECQIKNRNWTRWGRTRSRFVTHLFLIFFHLSLISFLYFLFTTDANWCFLCVLIFSQSTMGHSKFLFLKLIYSSHQGRKLHIFCELFLPIKPSFLQQRDEIHRAGHYTSRFDPFSRWTETTNDIYIIVLSLEDIQIVRIIAAA